MNKIAFVSGASSGIGSAIALGLAGDGFDVFVHYNKGKERALKIVEQIQELGQSAYPINADLTSEFEVKKLPDEVGKYSDKIDLLVNNAGFDYGYLFEEYTIEQMRYVLNSVLFSTVMVTKVLLNLLKASNSGQIINIASRMGKERSTPTTSIYGPAKAGVIKFTEVLAIELSKYKIRVNCVSPGLVRTPMTEDLYIKRAGSKDLADNVWKDLDIKNPSGRVGKPLDVANAVSFLASDNAAYINGETLNVNGGSNLG